MKWESNIYRIIDITERKDKQYTDVWILYPQAPFWINLYPKKVFKSISSVKVEVCGHDWFILWNHARGMRPYFHARCADTTEIYGGGVGGEEEKNISFEYKNVRNFLH